MQLIDLLLGDFVAGIDFESALELSESAVQITALDEDATAVDVSSRGLESHARELLFEDRARKRLAQHRRGPQLIALRDIEIVQRAGDHEHRHVRAWVVSAGRLLA